MSTTPPQKNGCNSALTWGMKRMQCHYLSLGAPSPRRSMLVQPECLFVLEAHLHFIWLWLLTFSKGVPTARIGEEQGKTPGLAGWAAKKKHQRLHQAWLVPRNQRQKKKRKKKDHDGRRQAGLVRLRLQGPSFFAPLPPKGAHLDGKL